MNEPQVWTLIGVFAAGMSAVIGLTLRVVTAEIGKASVALGAQIEALRGEMNARFEHLDCDVQALTNRVFPDR